MRDVEVNAMNKRPEGDHYFTQRETAEILGICQQRVWELERQALKKLRVRFLADPIIREYILEKCNPNASNPQAHPKG